MEFPVTNGRQGPALYVNSSLGMAASKFFSLRISDPFLAGGFCTADMRAGCQ
jgi:hypothetical protein